VVRESIPAGRVLFLGAGGTAQSSAVMLRDAGYEVTILNRSAPRLEYFRELGFETATWEEFAGGRFDLVVNMSSAGLEDESLPAPEELLKEVLQGAKAAVDVIYGRQTPFLCLAKALGVPTRDGSDMLLYQGVIAFDYFTDRRFKRQVIETVMRGAFLLP
jgi:shikimate dehydrogenase